ncbi:MAG: GNAT family N-acetyltransferase [Pseudomonadota bacterium]
MNISYASINDLEQIVTIYNQAIKAGQKTADTRLFSVEQRLKWFEEHQQDSFPLLVATNNEQLLGYLTISPYRNGRLALNKTAEVSYYIDFNHHGEGVGSLLLEHAIELCPKLHLNTLIAILIGSNNGSINLLKKFGFKEWGCMPDIVHLNDEKFDHLYYGLHV